MIRTCPVLLAAGSLSCRVATAALPPEPRDPAAPNPGAWDAIPPGLNSRFASLDAAYPRSPPPRGESSFECEPGATRAVWIAADIPPDVPAGSCRGEIIRQSAGGATSHPITLVVQNRALPPPAEWSFHLDLRQNPFIVPRHHEVEPWSPRHLDLLRPLLHKLADAGQKCITTTIIHAVSAISP